MAELKIGDRVRVEFWKYGGKICFRTVGEIIGESRDGDAWRVQADGRKTPETYDKDFCHPDRN